MPNIPALVTAVTDGDTIRVLAQVWKGLTIETAVRVAGIDTPEKGSRAKSAHEAELGKQATEFARQRFPVGSTVRLSRIEDDKYGGRVLADVHTADGASWAEVMIAAGYARAYDGGSKSPW